MKRLSQEEYYNALEKFVSDAGINAQDKKQYCQYYTNTNGVYCKATSLDTCKNCSFFTPTTPKKLEIVASHALSLEELNDSLMKENEVLQKNNKALEKAVKQYEAERGKMEKRIKKLGNRVSILKYLKPSQFTQFFSMSIIKNRKPVEVKEKDRHLNKKLMKEWDETRLLINPNAKR